MAAFVAGSREQGGTGAVTFTLPTGWAVDDILLLICESNVGETVAAPTGYTQCVGSPISATDTQIALFWKRAVSGETAPVIADAGDHVAAHMWLVRGAKTTGNPILATSNSPVTTASAALDFATINATTGGNLVFMAASITRDSDTNPTISATSMTNVENGVEGRDGYSTTQGAGGGVVAMWGTVAGSGNVDGSMTINAAYNYAAFSLIIESADIARVEVARSMMGFVVGDLSVMNVPKAAIGFVVDESGGGGVSSEIVRGRIGFVVNVNPPYTYKRRWRAQVN